jgi:aspartate aminotransferase
MATDNVKLANRISDLKPTAINTILGEVRELKAQGRNVVSLMRGEPDFPTPSHIVDAATAALHAGRTSYPENRGELSLREAVSLKMKRDNGITYDAASEILVTDGATLGIHAAIMTLLEPGDEILVPDPIYDAYTSPIRLAGAQPRRVRSTRGNTGRFELTVESLEAAITPAARALLLNDPWNPVGTVLTRAEITKIAEFALRHNLIIVSDEIYEAITYGDSTHLSPAALSPEIRRRCIVVNSLSKTYAMTGWRVGYCAAPEHLIKPMLLVLQQSSRGPATFVQDAAAAALAGPQDCVAEMRNEYANRRQSITDTLSGLPNINVLPPEGGFFTMLDVSRTGSRSDDVRRHLLHQAGVAVVHGSAYGECGEGTLRVSFGSGGATLSTGLKLLREGLQTV